MSPARNVILPMSQNLAAIDNYKRVGIYFAFLHIPNMQPHPRINPPIGIFLNTFPNYLAVNNAIRFRH